MFCFLSLIVVLVTLSSVASRVLLSRHNSSAWNLYREIYGDKVNAAFISTSLLDFSIESENRQIFDIHSNGIRIGCGDYHNSSRIASQLLTLSHSWGTIRPFVVNEISKVVCYAIDSKNSLPYEIADSFSHVSTISSPLRLHESVYGTLEQISSDVPVVLPDVLVVSTLLNSSLTNTSVEVGNIQNLFSSMFLIKSYPISLFDQFLWSSEASSYYFTMPNISNTEKRRHELWSNASSFLSKESQLIEKDPCRFKNIKVTRMISGVSISLSLLQNLNWQLRSSCFSFLAIFAALQPETFSVSAQMNPQLFNYRSRSIQQSGSVGTSYDRNPYTQAGLKGNGQIVSVADTGVDTQNCYFYDSHGSVPATSLKSPVVNTKFRKIIQYSYYEGAGDANDVVSGHGTHVCGTVVGNKYNSDITVDDGVYDGVAPNAKLAFIDLSTSDSIAVPPASELYGNSYSAGARVHTNSWGTMYNFGSFYYSAAVDQFLYENMDYAIFFAAGNFGSNGKQTCSLESQGKNVIAVGSSESTLGSPNINYIAFYSSLGPSYDGRIKPDIIAPGDSIQSALSNGGQGMSCSTTVKTGTSMASPGAAGVALLIRQYFIDATRTFWTTKCQPKYQFCRAFEPSGVLLKTLILHSGSSLSRYNGGGPADVYLGSTPDTFQGYGRIQLSNALPLSSVYNFDLFVDDLRIIQQYTTLTYEVDVTSSTRALRVTMAWYDPPSIDGITTVSLINNLDLLLTSPSGTNMYGNNGNQFDILNTNEQVIAFKPEKGIWKVKISSKSLPYSGSQKFSIAISCIGSVTSFP